MCHGGTLFVERIAAGGDLAEELACLCPCHVESNAMAPGAPNGRNAVGPGDGL
jgi:hypothetical protein